ncbi:unnamed protein product [Toxocara canis]|nr:unnamed protein product [Toxocara canis]
MNFGINKSLKMLQRVNMLNSKHSEENPSDEDYDKELVRLSGTKINDAQRELRDRYAKELLRRLTQISSLMRRKSAIAAYSNF